ncbi:MAG: hypothetical protein KC933_12645 [Myxococcales bacterium]|nr:hypothetical protein [Myxococcales bacterium]MCB9650790.1 hypothetical protein [Deltaproteobacteria bacterium]
MRSEARTEARAEARTRERVHSEWRRFADYREFMRGKQDGRLGYPAAGVSVAYIEGYILGRKQHHGISRR